MRLCIPVRQPQGLDSEMEPHLPAAEHLLFFDTDSRAVETLSLREAPTGPGADISFGAVLCGSINRMTLRALIDQEILVYGTEAQTVAQAIAQYENGELSAVTSAGTGGCGSHGHEHGEGGGCGGGGCGGHDHDHAHGEGGGCGGGGCGGHGGQGGGCGSHDHEHAHTHGEGGGCGGGGCGGHGHAHEHAATEVRPIGDVLRIAVTSQNRKTITEHAGKCRKFWVYEVCKGQVVAKSLLELAKDQSFHESAPSEAHPLDGINVLISSGMGSGLQQRLRQRGIQGLVTAETDPDQAVALYLEAALSDLPPQRAWVSACSHENVEA